MSTGSPFWTERALRHRLDGAASPSETSQTRKSLADRAAPPRRDVHFESECRSQVFARHLAGASRLAERLEELKTVALASAVAAALAGFREEAKRLFCASQYDEAAAGAHTAASRSRESFLSPMMGTSRRVL